MTLSDYLIFVTIAQNKSLTITADSLYLTKSAVSHSLAKIEGEIGVPLFNRNNKGFTITKYGEQLLPKALAVLREHEKFNDQIVSLQGMESGTVRIGTCSSICSNWIPDIVNTFKKSHPNIEIQIRGGASNQNIIEWISNNEIDIGIGTSEPNPSIDIDEVYLDEMICITPPDISTKHESYITAEELSQHPILMQEHPYNEEVLEVLKSLGVNLKSYITGYDDAILVAMTESSLGYCIQGKLVMKRISAAVKAYSFNPKQYRHFAILTKHGFQKSPSVNEMCRLIKKYAMNYPTDYELNLLSVPHN